MSGVLGPPAGSGAPVRGWFPWPFVGVSVILAVLVLVTPVLIGSGPPAPGSIFTQGEFDVDRAPGGNTTNFYVHALSETVRYSSISIGIATDFTFSNGSFPTTPLDWSWTNGTGLLELGVEIPQVPGGSVAVNVSAEYVSGGTAYYGGLFAFGLFNGSSGDSLSIAISPSTPGIGAPSSVLVSDLPLSIALLYCSSRACA
jgi:hypothetical protein